MNNKQNSFLKTFSKLVAYVLIVLLLLGIVRFGFELINRPDGMYLLYEDKTITASSGGVTVPYYRDVTFTIKHSDGFGVYSVKDCTVTIVPNVDEVHDFDFSIEGGTRPYSFSNEKDLSAAFVENYDGKGITVSEDGEFKIKARLLSMQDILSAIYPDKTVTLDSLEDFDTNIFPYFAIKVVSPDGSQTLKLPVLIKVLVQGIEVSPGEVIF